MHLTLLSANDENTDEMEIMNQYLSYLTKMIIERCGDHIGDFFKNNCVKDK